jgi:hypothetical protein
MLATWCKFNVGIPDCQIQICETKSQMKQISNYYALFLLVFTNSHVIFQLQKKKMNQKNVDNDEASTTNCIRDANLPNLLESFIATW